MMFSLFNWKPTIAHYLGYLIECLFIMDFSEGDLTSISRPLWGFMGNKINNSTIWKRWGWVIWNTATSKKIELIWIDEFQAGNSDDLLFVSLSGLLYVCLSVRYHFDLVLIFKIIIDSVFAGYLTLDFNNKELIIVGLITRIEGNRWTRSEQSWDLFVWYILEHLNLTPIIGNI